MHRYQDIQQRATEPVYTPDHDGVPRPSESQQAMHRRTGAGLLRTGDNIEVNMVPLNADRSQRITLKLVILVNSADSCLPQKRHTPMVPR